MLISDCHLAMLYVLLSHARAAYLLVPGHNHPQHNLLVGCRLAHSDGTRWRTVLDASWWLSACANLQHLAITCQCLTACLCLLVHYRACEVSMALFDESAAAIQRLIAGAADRRVGRVRTIVAILSADHLSAKLFVSEAHTYGACQVLFWDLLTWLPHNPANGRPDRDLLVAVCGQEVLHSSCWRWSTVDPGVRLVSFRARWVLCQSGVASASTQGFEPLLQNIIQHVVEMTVDIIVCGAWLCTNAANQAEVHIRSLTRVQSTVQ